jgi:chromo domain-containing protein 1
MIGGACRLEFRNVFCSNSDETMYLDRRAFLLFHPDDHAEELEVIVRWLLMHHVEVYTLHVDGAWDHFQCKISEGGSGVIMAHPTYKRFWTIPKFGQVLRSNVRVWSVGSQYAAECDQQLSATGVPVRYDCIEIFPHGGIIYITDDVFEKEPALAFMIIALFIQKVDQCGSVPGPLDLWKFVNDRCLLWRLAVRPELIQATWDWCEAHAAEIDAGEPAAQARAHLYRLLTESHYIEQDCPGEWTKRPDDYWPIISERREVSEAYFKALQHGQEQANDLQVEQFAGTVIDLRRDYRHFSVVHTEPSKVDWQSRWHNIDEVMTPEQCIEYLEQPAHGNRFEFYIQDSSDLSEGEWDIVSEVQSFETLDTSST